MGDIEKRIQLLQAEITRLKLAGGGIDPSVAERLEAEIAALNSDFIALQSQVDGVETKTDNAAQLAESAYDNANSAHALAEVAQEDAQTAITQTATLDANKVNNTTTINGVPLNTDAVTVPAKVYNHNILIPKISVITNIAFNLITEFSEPFANSKELFAYIDKMLSPTNGNRSGKLEVTGYYYLNSPGGLELIVLDTIFQTYGLNLHGFKYDSNRTPFLSIYSYFISKGSEVWDNTVFTDYVTETVKAQGA